MDIAFITSGYLPVPPSKGGAVENLIYNLIKANEFHDENKFTVYSIYDSYNQNFSNTKIKYIKVSFAYKIFDLFLYSVAKYILKKEHLISYRYFFQRMDFLKKVGKDLSKNEYDRVILENNVVMFKALEQKDNFEKYKDKIYYHAHNEPGKTLGYEKYFDKLTKVVSVSDYITEQYKKIINDFNVKFQTVHNVVDETLFMKNISIEESLKIKEQLGICNNAVTLLFTGRISEEKGIFELIEALSKIKTNQYNLLIVGKSFYGANVKDNFEIKLQEAADKLKGNIVFTGFVDYKEMYKYYQLSDICILPSVWNEPCALTIIECVASGTPLITTNTGGTPENTVDSTILLNIDGLVDNLASKLEFYIDNKSALENFKKNAQAQRNRYGSLQDYYNEFIESMD